MFPDICNTITITRYYLKQQKQNEMTTITLQGLGTFKAQLAGNIQVNDTLVWNFGETTIVSEIVKQNEKSIWIKELTKKGQILERRFSKTRAVAILKK